ncbi:MAG: FG-GAP-like repeat-containing protein, partial [Anaerolineae bacterium]|nr:FG-GAP-like repeat-containing protein [Anaerolineae bacterium]
MSWHNFSRTYKRITRAERPARVGRQGQVALALILCLSMIMSTVLPALAGDETPPPPVTAADPAPVEGGQEAPLPDDVQPPPDDEQALPAAENKGNMVMATGDSLNPALTTLQSGVHVEDKTNLSSGAATYHYSLEVPPGAGGMQPNLVLGYNSQVKWGVLGYGWSIAGLDMIARSTKNGAPQYDASDTFVLGGEDLIFHDGYYHTKHENYHRIQNVGGSGAGSYWVVTDKSGTQYRFGYDDTNLHSRIEAVGKDSAVRVWMLDRVLDTNGNYMTISYSEDTTNGDFYPDTITYAYNDAGGIGAYHTVKFNWQARPDVRSSYAQGALVKIDQRLANIEVQSGGNLLRKYTLDYSTGSGGKSQLWKITECGTDGTTCLPPAQFDYQVLDSDWSERQTWGDTEGTGGGSYVRHVNSGNDTQVDMLDMNGDGLPDVVHRESTSTNNGEVWVWLNTGSGWSERQTWGDTEGTGGGSYVRHVNSGNDTQVDMLDMNGDGLPDVVHRESTSTNNGEVWVWLNTGSGWSERQTWGDTEGTGGGSY